MSISYLIVNSLDNSKMITIIIIVIIIIINIITIIIILTFTIIIRNPVLPPTTPAHYSVIVSTLTPQVTLYSGHQYLPLLHPIGRRPSIYP